MIYTVKLGWGFLKPIACNTLVPETGPPFWKPFLLPAILRSRFWAGFWPQFWDYKRADRSCSTVLTAWILSICWRQPSFCNASRHGHTHISIMLWGDVAQKLFWISEKGPLSGAARSHANLLRSGSVPPLQRLCHEAVLRASWEGRNPLFTCGLEGRNRDVRGAYPQMGAVIPYLHAVLRGKIGTYEGRCNIKDGMDDKVKKK